MCGLLLLSKYCIYITFVGLLHFVDTINDIGSVNVLTAIIINQHMAFLNYKPCRDNLGCAHLLTDIFTIFSPVHGGLQSTLYILQKNMTSEICHIVQSLRQPLPLITDSFVDGEPIIHL